MAFLVRRESRREPDFPYAVFGVRSRNLNSAAISVLFVANSVGVSEKTSAMAVRCPSAPLGGWAARMFMFRLSRGRHLASPKFARTCAPSHGKGGKIRYRGAHWRAT